MLVLAASVSVGAQDDGGARYESASEAWDAGNYPEALRQFQQLLKGPGGDRFIEPIALLTGEWYRSTEISPADRLVVNLAAANAPKWSPDGRFFAFESTAGRSRRVHLFGLNSGEPRALGVIDGSSATFSFDGTRVSFLRVVEDDELRAARAALERGPAGGIGVPALGNLEAAKSAVIERNLRTGAERIVGPPGATMRQSVHYSTDDQLYVTAAPQGANQTQTQAYRLAAGGDVPLATAPTRIVQALAGGRLLVTAATGFGILDPANGSTRTFPTTGYAASASGESIVFLARSDAQTAIHVVAVAGTAAPSELQSYARPLANPVLSPDGRRVAFQMMPREDWELFVIDTTDKSETRITSEIQHDHTPRFAGNDRLLGIIGENRHRRSYLYDLGAKRRARLFHNNLLRTLSMEHAWAVSPDGARVIIVADRDGDTISPERGVYLMDLTSTVGKEDVLTRLGRGLAYEEELRARGRRMFSVIAPQVRDVVRHASVRRVYEYAKDLVGFGSKHVTQPGNKLAADYIYRTLQSFGYAPQFQYFDVPAGGGRPPTRTANVIATLEGTTHPELRYVVGSHFDSVQAGPGADDNTSGSSALLEAARVLRGRAMPATITFVWFTGEEAGLLGSREYVRQAVARGDRIVGALNNDMVGFADDHRLDDTIRYSNAGLRDLQHASAFLFTNLITYDSRYYQGTDAASLYDGYGDIVAGIGSYPILGNPHYHQSHDQLDTVSFPLITEVARATTASIMLMASSPSRLKSVTATASRAGAVIAWTPSPERDVTAYVVRRWVNGQPRDRRVDGQKSTVRGLVAGDAVWVKAVNARGLEGWDWQRTVVK